MIAASWRLRRVWAMEASSLEIAMDRKTPELEREYEEFTEDTRLSFALESLSNGSRVLQNLSHHESRLTRLYHRALETLRHLRTGAGKIPQNEPKAGGPV